MLQHAAKNIVLHHIEVCSCFTVMRQSRSIIVIFFFKLVSFYFNAENVEKSQQKETKKWKSRIADKLRLTVSSESGSTAHCTFGLPLDKCVPSPNNEVCNKNISIIECLNTFGPQAL